MIGLLVWILIVALIFGLIFWVLGMIPLPAPFDVIARVVVGVIFIIILLSMVFGGAGWGPGFPHLGNWR